MKKLILLALAAFAFVAAAQTGKIQGPLPECDPCPWVR
jgi:hypothetical protein